MKAGGWAAIGSVAVAAASSACCWLPLLTVGLGFGAGGAAVALDRFRWTFLGAAALLLGVGFYLNYRREAHCAPDGSCLPQRPLLRTINRVVLWCSAILVAVFASFPELSSAVANGRGPGAGHGPVSPRIIVLEVGGMTCEACEVPVERALEVVSGIRSVRADAALGRVTLAVDSGAVLEDSLLRSRLTAAGYRLLGK